MRCVSAKASVVTPESHCDALFGTKFMLLSIKRIYGCIMYLFGLTGATASKFLRFGLRVLLKKLSRDEGARIPMPDDAEIERFKTAFRENYSLLRILYAVADGLNLYLQQISNVMIQNMFCYDWQHYNYVSNVFFFSPSGLIVACAITAPGSIYDSAITE